MRGIEYTFWQDGDYYLGFLNEYPEYWTQGTSRQDLLESLMGLLSDLQSEWFTEFEYKLKFDLQQASSI